MTFQKTSKRNYFVFRYDLANTDTVTPARIDIIIFYYFLHAYLYSTGTGIALCRVNVLSSPYMYNVYVLSSCPLVYSRLQVRSAQTLFYHNVA